MGKLGTKLGNWELAIAIRNQGVEAGKLISFTYFGGLFPLWGGYLLFELFQKNPNIANFTDHGEFALYSAATLGPALYYILKDAKTSTFLYRHFFAFVSILGLIVSVLFYVAVISVSVGQIPVRLNFGFLRTVTWGLFLTSVLVSFCVTVVDNNRSMGNIRDIGKQQLADLEEKFDNIGGKP